MIVVDACAWVRALVDESPVADSCRDTLAADPEWLAPAHMPTEVLRTLRRYEQAGLLATSAIEELAERVIEAPVRYVGPEPGLLRACWDLRSAVSAYDAPYLVLARTVDVPLVTSDGRLARTAARLGVTCLLQD